jgi:putative N6-adenine-specific DNA methylase
VLKNELLDLNRSGMTTNDPIIDIELSGNSAVTFRASRQASLYALCWLRSVHKLLELVASSDDDDHGDDYDHTNTNIILKDRDDVHTFIREKVNVKELLGDGQGGLLSVSVKVVLNNPRHIPQDLTHTHYTALTIKNALCDVVRDMRGDRPNVDIDNADVPLVAIFLGSKTTTTTAAAASSVSSSAPFGRKENEDSTASLCLYRSLHPPGSLHRRGYRQGSAIHKAAMKESLAAGLLLEAGWLDKLRTLKNEDNDKNANGGGGSDRDRLQSRLRFIDPMAGSGSLVIEATMMAADIAPGLMRVRCGVPNSNMPPVTRWKNANAEKDQEEEEDTATMWKRILLEATQRAKDGIQYLRQNDPSRIRIGGNDIHPGAVDIMESALTNAGLSDFVDITNMDCYDLTMMEDDIPQDKDVDVDDDDGNVHAVLTTARTTTTSTTCLVATNPPWGVRLTDDIEESWEGLRHFIRDKCPQGTEVYVLSGDKTATGTLKLKRDRMIPLQTGDQNLRWIQYTIGGSESGGGTTGGTRRGEGTGTTTSSNRYNENRTSNSGDNDRDESTFYGEAPVRWKNTDATQPYKKQYSTNGSKKQYSTNGGKKSYSSTNGGKKPFSTTSKKVRPDTATTAKSERNEWL